MKQNKYLHYLFNCFWLTLPALAVSALFTNYLPSPFHSDLFWSNIPCLISTPESIFRFLVIIIPIFFPIHIITKAQKIGLTIYCIGLALYLFSWAALIFFPESNWGRSLIGFTAPATTPLIWLTGIGLIMEKPFVKLHYMHWIYLVSTGLFFVFHFAHTGIIYCRYY